MAVGAVGVAVDDVRRARAVVDAAARSAAPFGNEFRAVRPDGETRNIHSRGTLLRDSFGRPVRIVGTV